MKNNQSANLPDTQDRFAIFQLKDGPEYHMLRFAGLDELTRDGQRLRRDVHGILTAAENEVFRDKAEAESYLRDAGFTVVPNPDPEFITVQNPSRQEAILYLTYGDNCCRLEGCDTRGADLHIRHEDYNLVYVGTLTGLQKDRSALLEEVYARFNLDRPDDFHGHSLSVSDVIMISQDGQTACYYTDSIGFRELPDFLPEDNPLRNAEMAMEDDYDMTDGIINNGPKKEHLPTEPETMHAEPVTAHKPHADAPER